LKYPFTGYAQIQLKARYNGTNSEICSPDLKNLEPPDALLPVERIRPKVETLFPGNEITNTTQQNTFKIL
jgi:hypothetical protein